MTYNNMPHGLKVLHVLTSRIQIWWTHPLVQILRPRTKVAHRIIMMRSLNRKSVTVLMAMIVRSNNNGILVALEVFLEARVVGLVVVGKELPILPIKVVLAARMVGLVVVAKELPILLIKVVGAARMVGPVMVAKEQPVLLLKVLMLVCPIPAGGKVQYQIHQR